MEHDGREKHKEDLRLAQLREVVLAVVKEIEKPRAIVGFLRERKTGGELERVGANCGDERARVRSEPGKPGATLTSPSISLRSFSFISSSQAFRSVNLRRSGAKWASKAAMLRSGAPPSVFIGD